MKNTKKWKKLITLTGIAVFSFAAFFSPVATIIAEANVPSTVSPCADKIEWRFKKENGKLYKRLFNYSTGAWESEWIYVCDL